MGEREGGVERCGLAVSRWNKILKLIVNGNLLPRWFCSSAGFHLCQQSFHCWETSEGMRLVGLLRVLVEELNAELLQQMGQMASFYASGNVKVCNLWTKHWTQVVHEWRMGELPGHGYILPHSGVTRDLNENFFFNHRIAKWPNLWQEPATFTAPQWKAAMEWRYSAQGLSFRTTNGPQQLKDTIAQAQQGWQNWAIKRSWVNGQHNCNV